MISGYTGCMRQKNKHIQKRYCDNAYAREPAESFYQHTPLL